MTLLLLKHWFWKTVLFLCCQIVHVTATHQHFHLVDFVLQKADAHVAKSDPLDFVEVQSLLQSKIMTPTIEVGSYCS